MTGVEIPLTLSQQFIWTGQALDPEAPLYNMCWRFDINGALDPTRFGEAFACVVREADAMRLVFLSEGSTPRQLIFDEMPALPPLIDLSAAADPESKAAAWIAEDLPMPHDLSRATWRSQLLRLGEAHWVWVFNQHHIATDGWSGGVMFRQVAAHYAALSDTGNAPSPLGQFTEFARKEASERSKGKIASAQNFWQTRGAEGQRGAPPYGRKRETSARARRVSIPLSHSDIAGIRDRASMPGFRSLSSDLSLFAILATALTAYLHRVTGDTKLSIGAPSHNRLTDSARRSMGLFIEMFPLWVEVEDGDTFRDLHKKVLADTMTYLRHAKPGAGNLNATSMFRAVLNYIPVTYGNFSGLPCHTTWLQPGAQDPGHDLRLNVYDFNNDDDLVFELDVNAAMFAEAEAEDAAAQFAEVVRGFLADPDQRLTHVALTDRPPQAALQLADEIALDHETVLDALAGQISERPGAIAVRCGDERLTYTALGAHANSWTARLQAQGVAPGQTVILNAKRSIHLLPAWLGVLQAGALPVPVSSDAPHNRVAAIVEAASPSAIIADDATAENFQDTSIPCLRIGSDDIDTDPALRPVSGQDLAYILFTSGSTGLPKGVTVSHDALMRYVGWAARSYGKRGPKNYAFHSAIGFDLTLTSIFVPLVTGGTVVVYPETPAGPDLAVLDAFADDAVDVVKMTPSHLALVCRGAAPVRRIHTLILGGEALTTDLARRAQSRLGAHVQIANEYGPTEGVVGCMIHWFDPATDNDDRVPIGRAAEDVGIYLLDDGDNPVPDGVVGEIHIGGARLAQGYHQRPDSTDAAFRPDPFVSDGLMYRTGDLARILPSGALDYLGRRDTQLKLGGIRTEAGEIAAAITAIPGIEECHVQYWLPPQQKKPEVFCRTCGLPETYPGAEIDPSGLCQICADFAEYRERAQVYFRTPDDLKTKIAALDENGRGAYDAIMLLSGGKDSTYAAYRLAALTPRVLALTLDNGYLSDQAKANIRNVAADLGLDHRFMKTPVMNEIFQDSLSRHANVCHGCFKTVYTLALRVARDEGIPAIVTGLSRGQFFETRLTPDLFRNAAPSCAQIEQVVHGARKAYHGIDDAVARLLQTDDIRDSEVLDEVEFIDIYRYIDVPVSEIYDFLDRHSPWTRPGDTGRSTNCLVNDVGIYVHQKLRGFHNYALPYSWDVRMGHKNRDQALAELHDDIDETRVLDLLGQIGAASVMETRYRQPQLTAYYVASQDADIGVLRQAVRRTVGPAGMPQHFVRVDALPLTGNGKVDGSALPAPPSQPAPTNTPYASPQTALEAQLARLVSTELSQDVVGRDDNFYDLGGDSIAAIQIAIQAADQGIPMEPADLFEYQTVAVLAAALEERQPTDKPAVAPTGEAPLIEVSDDDMLAVAAALARGGMAR